MAAHHREAGLTGMGVSSSTDRPFAKGHGTGNDFLILPDPDGGLPLSAEHTMRLCDRRTGVGADGILRAVRCAAEPEAGDMANTAEWFMDYRNADGSRGAMCGNGIRVLARYLVDTGLCAPGHIRIATRAGIRRVHVPDSAGAPIGVGMGRPVLPGPGGITVTAGGRSWPATQVDMGNPHAVVMLSDLTAPGSLRSAPLVEPTGAYPLGVTVEFVVSHTAEHLQLRVHERGVGETLACGTGACAAVAAFRAGTRRSGPGEYLVDSPGGRLRVGVGPEGEMELAGAAQIVAHGTIGAPLWDTGA
ncbi:diaminopimelate epimerase [Streptomyces sp. NPDC001777]|uniref:diaminopimelate epimerase n=1 Tax=Streptomyces sp. NPDC001777 TaxID=3364608 RepID=UPI00367C4A72